jgi:hypothetical protein
MKMFCPPSDKTCKRFQKGGRMGAFGGFGHAAGRASRNRKTMLTPKKPRSAMKPLPPVSEIVGLRLALKFFQPVCNGTIAE